MMQRNPLTNDTKSSIIGVAMALDMCVFYQNTFQSGPFNNLFYDVKLARGSLKIMLRLKGERG